MTRFHRILFNVCLLLLCFCKHATAQYAPRYLTAVVEYSRLLADSNSYTANAQVSWQRPASTTLAHSGYVISLRRVLPTAANVFQNTNTSIDTLNSLNFTFNKPRNTTDTLQATTNNNTTSTQPLASPPPGSTTAGMGLKVSNGGIVSIVIDCRTATDSKIDTGYRPATNNSSVPTIVDFIYTDTYYIRTNISPAATQIDLVIQSNGTTARFPYKNWSTFNTAFSNVLNTPPPPLQTALNSIVNMKTKTTTLVTYLAATDN